MVHGLTIGITLTPCSLLRTALCPLALLWMLLCLPAPMRISLCLRSPLQKSLHFLDWPRTPFHLLAPLRTSLLPLALWCTSLPPLAPWGTLLAIIQFIYLCVSQFVTISKLNLHLHPPPIQIRDTVSALRTDMLDSFISHISPDTK